MADPRDLAHVRACLDDPFTPHLLALADWHEEAGQGALARAYRRIVRERKVPAVATQGWYWRRGERGVKARYFLPFPTWAVMNRCMAATGVVDTVTATLSQAYHALALAYAEEEGP